MEDDMQAEQLYRDYSSKQSDAMADAAAQSARAYEAYAREVQDASAGARRRAEQLWNTYTQELRAAAAGDDAWQRSNGVARQFQRDYATIEGDYARDCAAAYTRLVTALGAIAADARGQALDDTIGYLQALKDSLPADSSAR
jgi:hypothetical protein